MCSCTGLVPPLLSEVQKPEIELALGVGAVIVGVQIAVAI
jgi:hypothetical protein